MSIIDTIAGRLGYEKAAGKYPQWALEYADSQKYVIPDGYRYGVQADMYRLSTWIQIAVSMSAQSCALVPLQVVKVKGEGRTEAIESHPFEVLLNRPNPHMPRFTFLESVIAYRRLTGNSYIWLNARSPKAPPDELWVIPPHKIKPVPDGRQYLSHYEYDNDGAVIRIPVDEIVHWKSFNPLSPFIGLSPVEALMVTTQGDLAMQKWNTNFFGKNNAKPSGGLFISRQMAEAKFNEMKQKLESSQGGVQRNLLIAQGLSKDDVHWIQFGMNQKDMEFLLARKFNREEIFQMFGIPMGIMDANATEANATVADAGFAKRTQWPLLVSFAELVTNTLLPRYGDGLLAEFEDPRISDERLELDQLKTWESILTVDELREVLDKPPIGDERGAKLVAEIRGGSAIPNQSAPPDDMVEDDLQPEEQDGNPEPTPPEDMPDDSMMNGDKGKEAKAVADSLRLWRKKSLRMFAQKGTGVCAFDATIDAGLRNKIAYGLATAGDTAAIKAVFDAEIKAVEGEYTAEVIEAASAVRRLASVLQGTG